MSGTLIISLDFELYWGVRDLATLEDYGENVRGTRHAIPAMLETFGEHGIRATWATVGFLFFDAKADLLASLPLERPAYAEQRLSPYPMLRGLGESEAADPYHFGRSLLERIRAVPGQEIGTHTFSHYYALAKGQTRQAFRSDLQAAIDVGSRFGVEIRSLVWPRNQTNVTYLGICRELGLTSYRGNERSWMYRQRSQERERLVKRGARLLDAYVNVSGHNTYRLEDVARTGAPYNLRASRFLRPWSATVGGLEERRLQRIEASMTYAATRGEAFHLWWHPHNFGTNLRENMRILARLLGHYRRLHETHGMESLSMGDVAARLLGGSPAYTPSLLSSTARVT